MLLNFLFPQTSLTGAEGEWITCAELRKLASHPRLFEKKELERRGLTSLDRLFAASSYRECPLLRKAIHSFKYRMLHGVGERLQEIFVRELQHIVPKNSDACICPVPLHFFRIFSRGFNQAEMLADSFSLATGMPVNKLISRIRPTGHQTKRTREERWKAMCGAFRIRARTPAPLHVYLVDDVFTTGATMEECAMVLKQAGVIRVDGIALAYD